MKKRFLSAFTLSEALLALVIIGIISALTIPTLVAKYQKDLMLVQIKKAYNAMEHNLTLLQSENIYRKDFSSLLTSKYATNSGLKPFIKEGYKVIKDCGSTPQPCFAEYYYSVESNNQKFAPGDGFYNATVGDGSAISIGVEDPLYMPSRYVVYVDVNASEDPNVGGRDMFKFYINTSDTSIATKDVLATTDPDCTKSPVGDGCLNKIMDDNWKMNY